MEIKYLHHGDIADTALVHLGDFYACREKLLLHKGAIVLLERDEIDPDLILSLVKMLGRSSKVQAVATRESNVLVLSEAAFGMLRADRYENTISAFEEIVAQRKVAAICLEKNPQAEKPKSAAPTQEKKKVMLFAPYGMYVVHNQVEAVLGMALSVRGSDVFVIGCDGLFTENCYVLYHDKDKASACANCAQQGVNFFSQFGLPYESMRVALKEEDFAEASRIALNPPKDGWQTWEYENVPLGKILQTSICSYLRITPKSFPEERVQNLFGKYAVYSFLCYRAMSRIIEEREPDHIILFNGNGFLHGVVFYIAKQKGIPTLCHEKGMSEGTFLLNDSESAANPLPMLYVSRAWRDASLDESEISRVRDFFVSREHGKGTNHELFYRYQSSHATALKQLRLPTDSSIFGMFTSSEYELVYWAEFMRIPDQIEIIDHLMEIYRKRDDYLVVRHHPGIAARDTQPPDFHLMTRAWDQSRRAPKNVRIIHPAEKLTTYALLPFVKACIAPFSAVSIEATARGIPTAACEGNIFTEGVCKTISDTSRKSIEETVEFLYNYQFTIADLVKLYRSSHAVFYRHPVSFKSFSIRDHSNPDIRIQSLSELLPGNDETLDRVCDFILKGSDLYDLPKDRKDNSKIENSVFATELKNIETSRASARNSVAQIKEQPVTVIDAVIPGMPALSESIGRQRHNSISREQWFISGNWTKDISALENILAHSSSEAFAIWFPSVEYDSSYISASVDRLDAEIEMYGIIWGGWGRGASRFEQKLLARDMIIYKQRDEEFSPLWALCSTVFLKRGVPELLSILRRGKSSEERSSNLKRFLLEGPFIREDVQSVAVPSRENALVILDVEDGGRQVSMSCERPAVR